MPVAAQTTDFSFRSDDNLFCSPAQVQFSQTSSGRPKGYLWDFGNGVRSNSPAPSVTYNNPGNYRVRLITVYEKTTAEMTRIITINRGVSSSFTADRYNMCGPGTVNFNITASSNAIRHEWNFGDGSQVETTTINSISHTFNAFGTFNVTLKSFNEAGCSVSSSRTIQVSLPVISGTLTPTLGCAPATAQFNISVSLPPGNTVSNYQWNFGDGNIQTGTHSQITHTYQHAGSYSPSVTIYSNQGCSNTFHFDTVRFGNPPANHQAFTVQPVICGSDKAVFVSSATNANSYDWDFGNGNIVTTRDSIMEKKFSSLGIHTVTVTPKFNNCPGTPITLQVEVVGVIAKFTYNNTCNARRRFDFRNNSTGNITSLVWEIGDNATPAYTYNLSYQFPPYGNFPVKLTLADSLTGCVDSAAQRIYTANPALLGPGNSICINSNARFRIDRTYQNPSATYTWQVLGDTIGPNNQTEISIRAEQLGIFANNRVIIQLGNAYCPDTASINYSIAVKGPQLDFDAPENTCLNTALEITNRSRPYFPADSIKTWIWNMGNSPANDTTYQPQPYLYNQYRAYNITLTAKDINGCQDSLVKRVNIRPMPFIWIIPHMDTVCQGRPSSLIAYTSDQVLWTPSNDIPFCRDCDSISVPAPVSTNLLVKATNQYQCVAVDSASIHVVSPFTARASFSDTSICQKEKMMLDVEPKDKLISWAPAEEVSNPNIYNPIISPDKSTLFTANLSDSFGCFNSTANIYVRFKSKPTVDIGPDRTLPYFSNFTLQPRYSNNVRQYLWSPADSLSCANCPNPSGQAITSKKYTVTAISDSGCVAKDDINVFVECKGANILLPKAFTPNNDRLNDRYYPITRGIQVVQRFSIYNRYGQMLFEASNFSPNKNNSGWDGMFKGMPQPSAAYVYIMEAICETGQVITHKGSFMLIR